MLAVSRSQHARQSLHSLPWSGAAQVLSSGFVDTVDVHGQLFTGPWFIICELILIIKFGGTVAGSMSFKNFTSRVGIQCRVPGVRLHTVNIFSRCLRLCISPESCHLNQSWPLINVTIASTQSGCSRACSLRSSASRTLRNLYRPFIA